MSCFWDTLLQKLNSNKFNSNKDLILFLKNNNCKKKNVLWNNTDLLDLQYIENFNHIKDFNEDLINNGYDCSSCDPFLLLICELFELEIINHFNNTIINYKHKNYKKNIKINNDKGHMW